MTKKRRGKGRYGAKLTKRGKVDEFLGYKPDPDTKGEDITARAWLEEEGYALIKNQEIQQKDIAELFGLADSRISTIIRTIEKQLKERAVDDYANKLGKKKEKFMLKEGRLEKDGDDNMSDENEERELTGDEKDLVELMDSMNIGNKIQYKIVTFYRRAPEVYTNFQALADLMKTCGVRKDQARLIASNFVIGQGSPAYMPPQQLPHQQNMNQPYNPYYAGTHQGWGGDGGGAGPNKGGLDSIFEKIMMTYFSKAITNMFSDDSNRQGGGVPYVASEIVERPVVGPDGNLVHDEQGNLVYERTRREKPLNPTPNYPQTPGATKDSVTMKDMIELVKHIQDTNKGGGGSGLDRDIWKMLTNKLDSVENQLTNERLGTLYQELNAIKSHDPFQQFLDWKKMVDQIQPPSGEKTNLELEKMKLDQNIKLKELDMKQQERSEARELVHSLRGTLDTGITQLGGPLTKAVAAGIERKMSEPPAPTPPPPKHKERPRPREQARNTNQGEGNVDISQLTDEQLHQYREKINQAKARFGKAESEIEGELGKRGGKVKAKKQAKEPAEKVVKPAKARVVTALE